MKNKPEERFEAIHLVALGIDEVNARGTPRHSEAVAVLEAGRKLWLEQFNPKRCSKCGHKL